MGIIDDWKRRKEAEFDRDMERDRDRREELTEALDKKDLEKFPPTTFTHNGVLITYRLNPKTKGDLGRIELEKLNHMFGGADPSDDIKKRLRELINADPELPFEDYADELGIAILKVHRRAGGKKQYPGSVIGWSDE